jgi:hypothetical protein
MKNIPSTDRHYATEQTRVWLRSINDPARRRESPNERVRERFAGKINTPKKLSAPTKKLKTPLQIDQEDSSDRPEDFPFFSLLKRGVRAVDGLALSATGHAEVLVRQAPSELNILNFLPR